MAFKLENVVPWGRDLDEYRQMFLLSDRDMEQKIAGFGDGPACFNCKATKAGADVTSFDPIYGCSAEELKGRIEEVRQTVVAQMTENAGNYVWDRIKSVRELEEIRMSTMRAFLDDYEQGKREGRYICHELPNMIPAEDGEFGIGLSSHFLLMYTSLGYQFHIAAISEMLRACREVRIFPLCDLDGRKSELTERVIGHFKERFVAEILKTDYHFQRGASEMLRIRHT
ncbi:MAG: SAM-dependent methyltransferase [Ruminococcus sp.]|nr:SAM-dependent methyltransferase [Ruminococcus sp.]